MARNVEANVAHLRLCALWYGYGRKDAGDHIDVDAFASHYAALVAAFETEGFYLPSIQDAYRAYINNHRSNLEQKEGSS
jgi:hypothetical protein